MGLPSKTVHIVPCLKVGCALATHIGWAWVSSLGARLGIPKPNLEGGYPGTLLSLLVSCVWRRGAHAHTSFKHVAQVSYALFKSLTHSVYYITCTPTD